MDNCEILVEQPAAAWWPTLLSGAVGALIGAAATVAAVLVAFRLEHRRNRQENIRSVVSEVVFHAWAIMWDWGINGGPTKSKSWSKEQLTAIAELIGAVGRVIDACGSSEPEMKNGIEVITASITELDRPLDGVSTLHKFAKHWIRDPDAIRNGKVTPLTAAQETAAEQSPPASGTSVSS